MKIYICKINGIGERKQGLQDWLLVHCISTICMYMVVTLGLV